MQRKQAVIPIEVKAEENLKAKSLKVYVEQFQPKQAISFFHGGISGTGLAGKCAVVCFLIC